MSVDTGAFHNLKTNIGFDLTTKNNLSITFNYGRNQSKGSSHTDSLYFGGTYISNKETEYALALDGSESLNTSFNIKDEPIVCSPIDAYKCFTKTNLDMLVLGNFIIENKKVKLN